MLLLTNDPHETTMTTTIVKGNAVSHGAVFDLRSDPLDHIDAVATYATLWTNVRAYRDPNSRRLPCEIAERLDRLYVLRLAKLLRAHAATIQDVAEMDDHLSRVCRYAPTSGAGEPFEVRWNTLRSLLDTQRHLMTETRLAREQKVSESTAFTWEAVGKIVLDAPAEGIRHKDLLNALTERGVGPSSKGGVTHLIARMESAGQLETIRRGRELYISPGRVLLEQNQRTQPFERVPEWKSPFVELVHELQKRSGQAASCLHIVRDASTLHQSNSATYQLGGARLHRKLRKALDNKGDVGALAASYGELLGFLNLTFFQTCKLHFELLGRHFDNRGFVSRPRFCIKGNLANFRDKKEKSRVYTIFRDTNFPDFPRETEARLTENTGFEVVAKTGEHYLLNDIPAAVGHNKYRNPRLNLAKAAAYVLQRGASPDGKGSNQAWAQCWTDFAQNRRVGTYYYQSTLILPIVFKHAGVLPNEMHLLGLANDSKNILGFLCIDHEDCNYFDGEIDVPFASIFAEMLIPYLVKRLSLTRGSSNFLNAATLLNQVEMQEWGHLETEPIEQPNHEPRNSLVPIDSTFFFPCYQDHWQQQKKDNSATNRHTGPKAIRFDPFAVDPDKLLKELTK